MDNDTVKKLAFLHIKNREIKDLSPIELVELYKATYEEMQKHCQDNYDKWLS